MLYLNKMQLKLKLTTGQLNRMSEIFGNMAVAWLSAGVISPLFIPPQTVFALIFTLGVSLILAFVFFGSSLYLMKGIKY